MEQFSALGSSTFLRSEDGRLLAKFVADKYHWRSCFWRWLGRDLISKRVLGRYDSRLEAKSAAILNELGQATVASPGYGYSLNPFNRWSSVYVMAFMKEASGGRRYFHRLSESQRDEFIARMLKQAIALARRGYVHRDFHLDNLLVDASGTIIWIDTHLRRLSKKPHKRARALVASISVTKLDGESYASLALDRLQAAFPEVAEFRCDRAASLDTPHSHNHHSE